MEFIDNMYASSVFPILSQEILVSLPSLKKVEYYTEKDATKVERTKAIRYGPLSGEYKEEELRIHYELSQPLIYFPIVKRQIELSHFGSIGVTEHFELKNDAAELDGEFDRIKLNSLTSYRQQNHIFRKLHTQLPRRAFNLYYRDVIGNVTTSLATRESHYVFFEVRPRFPVLGGWQTKWYAQLSSYLIGIKGIIFSTNTILNTTQKTPISMCSITLLATPSKRFWLPNISSKSYCHQEPLMLK